MIALVCLACKGLSALTGKNALPAAMLVYGSGPGPDVAKDRQGGDCFAG